MYYVHTLGLTTTLVVIAKHLVDRLVDEVIHIVTIPRDKNVGNLSERALDKEVQRQGMMSEKSIDTQAEAVTPPDS